MAKKIILWTSSYHPVLGGLQTVVGQLAEGLVKKGFKVLVLTNRYPIGLKKHEHIDDIEIVRILHVSKSYSHLKGRILSLLLPIQRIKIKKAIQKFSPDFVHVHFPDAQLPYVKSIFFACQHAKWVTSFHGHDLLRYFVQGDEYQYDYPINNILQNDHFQDLMYLLNHSAYVTTCSQWLMNKANILFEYKFKINTIHNAVALNSFFNSGSHQINTPYLFAFGRLEEFKGFNMLISAYYELHKIINPPTLLIAGEGIELKNLQSTINKLHLHNKVILVGKLNRQEVVAYAKGALFNIIPSLRETFGIALLEALASNKPVLSSNRGGLPEAGADFATYFRPDVQSCTEAMLNFLSNPEKKHDEFQLNLHLSKFSVANMIDSNIELYKN